MTMTPIHQILQQASPVLPVLTVDRLADAQPLAAALRDGGCPVVEVTLRTDCALDVIRAMSDVDGVTVGAGTVTRPDQLAAVHAAGASFAVSPGVTADLLTSATQSALPWLPGVTTASEIMTAMAYGHSALKFFPAVAAGGVATLNAFAAAFPYVNFCPTGGVNPDNASDFLALSSVLCVGVSWLTAEGRLANQNWSAITEQAHWLHQRLTTNADGETGLGTAQGLEAT